MSATNFEQEREELNDEILQIKRTLQSMEGDEFSEDEEDEDVLCIDMDHSSGVAAGPVGSEQGTAPDLATHDDQLSSFAGSSTLPENSLKTVLSLNRAYQSVVRESLQRVELALDQNKERQMVMKEELDQEAQDKCIKSHKNPVVSFAVPYIRDTKGMNPPPNEDALIKRQSKEGNPYIRPPKQWSARDKKKLKDAVKSDALRTHMRPLMNRKEILMAKQFETSSLANIEDIESEMKQLDKDIEHIKGWSDSKLFGSRLDTSRIDWLKISSVDFDGERTAVACELMWKNAVHPSINSRKWNADEDTKLDDIVKEHGERDWTAIADQVGTNRTPFQCLQRYQTRLNPCLTTGKWTAEEDTFLLEVVGSLQEPDDTVPWNQVADYLEGRSQEQCLTRWSRLKDIEHSKYHTWSTEEDMKLIEAVQWFGPKSWVSVAKFVPGRNDIQCRERWTNALDTNLKIGNWSYEEDRTIWLSVQKHGMGKWVKLAEQLPGRTDNMVLHRYYRMKRCRDAQEQLSQIPMSKRSREATEKKPATNPVEARMIRADRAKGINVPRPVAGINSRFVKMLALRRRLHEMIKLRVQRGLTGSGCKPAQLDEMLEMNNNSATHTVRAMLDKSRLLEKTLSHTKAGEGWVRPGRKGRQKTSGEERQVRLEIVELLQAKMGKRPCGRPRTRHVEDDTDTAGANDTDSTTDTRTKIAKMFFQALQVDVLGMTKRVRDLRAKQSRVGDGKSSSTGRRRHRGDQLNTDIELWEAVAMETAQPGASGDEDSCPLVSASQSLPLVTVPPNATTLSAFKSLLLRKRSLSQIAGKKLQPKTARGRTAAPTGGSTVRVAIPPIAGVRMIDLHNSNMKVKDMIAIKNMLVGPTESSTADMPSQYYGVTEGQLEEMRDTRDYRRLRDRIHALFLWPALLSAISLDNLPIESTNTDTKPNNNSTGKKRKSRFPYTRGKKYRKYLMKSAKEREFHKEMCRKSMEKRMEMKKRGISADTSVDAVNSGEGKGKEAEEQREKGGAPDESEAPGEGRPIKRGRPRGGGKKRIWESFGVRETRGRSQRLANTQVAPSVDVQVAPAVSAPEGASGSEMASSTAVDGTNQAHAPDAPRVLGVITGVSNKLSSDVRETLPTEGSVVNVKTETEVATIDEHETLRPEGATSAETACSPPDGIAVGDQQRHLEGDDETTGALGSN